MSIQLLIPQLLYDLIGRVVPGGIFIIYCWVLTVTPNEIVESLEVWIKISLVAVVLIAILFSYVIGFLFGGLWFLFYRLFWWRVVKVAIEASVSQEFTDPPAFAANIWYHLATHRQEARLIDTTTQVSGVPGAIFEVHRNRVWAFPIAMNHTGDSGIIFQNLSQLK